MVPRRRRLAVRGLQGCAGPSRDGVPFALWEEWAVVMGWWGSASQKMTDREPPASPPEPARPHGKEVTVRMRSSLQGRGRPFLATASFEMARKKYRDICPVRPRAPLSIRVKGER